MTDVLNNHELFVKRHIGPNLEELNSMLESLGENNLAQFITKVVPEDILSPNTMNIDAPLQEHSALKLLKHYGSMNKKYRNFIGAGYYSCKVPSVILRTIVENPGWYTPYTPYQPEISQGRLESLFTFQTLISDLTGLPVAGASLLDEATAAMEAVILSKSVAKGEHNTFFASSTCHPQTLAVLETRCHTLGVELVIDESNHIKKYKNLIGSLLQYPNTFGHIDFYKEAISHTKEQGGLITLACDPLALTVLKSPAKIGADIAIGSAQRFGCTLSYGGPHAAFFATKDAYKRKMPGRIVGLSKDSEGNPVYRLALQTREQHIRKQTATSNICTAQALLANISAMYAVYHGAEGLKSIANVVYTKTKTLAANLSESFKLHSMTFFDTLCVKVDESEKKLIQARALEKEINLRYDKCNYVMISLDETSTWKDVSDLCEIFIQEPLYRRKENLTTQPADLARKEPILQHEVFNKYHSEPEITRYIKSLENKDLSLVHSMIPLGSCTMKLNAACEMLPFTWPEFANLHPFCPKDQAVGYTKLMDDLKHVISEVTGFPYISLQPNSGAQGELTGLLVIQKYFAHKGEDQRKICLIPSSAHGTNPASANLSGLKPVIIKCTAKGSIDLDDLKSKIEQYGNQIAAMMVTYPSTFGIFDLETKQCCQMIHEVGGQVYLDGANFNAKLGLVKAKDIHADVCHLNLHKTFCIPHGGGGPGAGPIGVADHLEPFLPSHPLSEETPSDTRIKAVAAAEYSSANLYVIPWMYSKVMGAAGLKLSSEVAILNANYIVKRLDAHYNMSFMGAHSFVAHECILNIKPLTDSSGVTVHDIAKRLIDYGFHAPTVSWPIPNSLMIEPTESESKAELDRFCDAMIAIKQEIDRIEKGELPKDNNPLKNAPHTVERLVNETWDHPYTREEAAYPLSYLKERKYWPPVSRVNEAFGDRMFCCTL